MILTKKKEILSTKSMILSALFVALIAIGAFIKVPVPVCPFTLQLLFTTLAGLLLGANLGFVSVCVYIIIGLIGIPIFTEGGGLGYIFQPTFGYLIGFAFGAYVAGYLTQNRTKLSFIYLLCVNFLNLLIVYAFGMVYVYIGIWPVVLYCFLLAVPGDIVLCILAAILGKKLIPNLKHYK